MSCISESSRTIQILKNETIPIPIHLSFHNTTSVCLLQSYISFNVSTSQQCNPHVAKKTFVSNLCKKCKYLEWAFLFQCETKPITCDNVQLFWCAMFHVKIAEVGVSHIRASHKQVSSLNLQVSRKSQVTVMKIKQFKSSHCYYSSKSSRVMAKVKQVTRSLYECILHVFGGYTYFRLACYLKTRWQCASLCVRWAEVSMTCTVVRPTAREF